MKPAAVMVAGIWIVFILDLLIPIDLTSYGLIPRTAWGLLGVVTSPLLHANLSHVAANTLPLFILVTILVGTCRNSADTLLGTVLLGGALLWVFGRPGVHVGASGLVFGLIAFLIVSGFTDRSLSAVIAAVVVAILYGGTLLTGVLPVQPGVSWEGHLTGAIAGAVMSMIARMSPPPDGRNAERSA